jgi:hypothetical protein
MTRTAISPRLAIRILVNMNSFGKNEWQAILRAPFRPAGHLPHEGGDRQSAKISPIANIAQ